MNDAQASEQIWPQFPLFKVWWIFFAIGYNLKKIKAFLNYLFEELIIKTALNKLKNSNFSNFFGNCGMFEFLDRILIDTHSNMAIDGDDQVDSSVENARLSNQEIADKVYEILVNFDNSGQGNK